MIVNTWVSVLKSNEKDTHKAVISAMMSDYGLEWWNADKDGKRRILFYRPHTDSLAIAIRFNVEPPAHFPAKPFNYEFHNGDKVKINVLLSAINSKYTKEQTGRTAMNEQDKMYNALKHMEKSGVKVSRILLNKAGMVLCKASNQNKAIKKPAYEVYVEGTVTDENALAEAILYGVGRDKTFGFGMIRLETVRA